LGFLSIYSFSDLQFSFYYFGEERFNGFFDILNIFTTHVLMPLSALLVTIFAGWRISSKDSQRAMAIPLQFVYTIWLLTSKYLAPLVILAVLIIVLLYPA